MGPLNNVCILFSARLDGSGSSFRGHGLLRGPSEDSTVWPLQELFGDQVPTQLIGHILVQQKIIGISIYIGNIAGYMFHFKILRLFKIPNIKKQHVT